MSKTQSKEEDPADPPEWALPLAAVQQAQVKRKMRSRRHSRRRNRASERYPEPSFLMVAWQMAVAALCVTFSGCWRRGVRRIAVHEFVTICCRLGKSVSLFPLSCLFSPGSPRSHLPVLCLLDLTTIIRILRALSLRIDSLALAT